MSSELIFADLFAFGYGSLAWVRVYRLGGGEVIVLALNPTDNPSASVANAAERLLSGLNHSFGGLGRLRVFIRFPDDPRGEGWTEILDVANTPEFQRHSMDEMTSLIDQEIPEPAVADATCASLGGQDHPLLAMIPSPDPERNVIDRLAVVAVADLPWPHHPGACYWKQRFEQLHSLYPVERNDHPAVGAHWFLTLTEADFEACRYHQADWKKIAEVSVNVFRELGDAAVVDNALEAVDRILGDSPEGRWCASLFRDPIVWPSKHSSVANGQHRSCALRASGAPLCVVDVEDTFIKDPTPGNPWRRAAAEVASYWANQAAL